MPRPKKPVEEINQEGACTIEPSQPESEIKIEHFPFSPSIRPYDESVERELMYNLQQTSSLRNIPVTELEGHFSYAFVNGSWKLTGEVIHKKHAKED